MEEDDTQSLPDSIDGEGGFIRAVIPHKMNALARTTKTTLKILCHRDRRKPNNTGDGEIDPNHTDPHPHGAFESNLSRGSDDNVGNGNGAQ